MYPGSGDKSRASQVPASKDVGASVIAMCDASDATNLATCAVELPAEPPEWIHLMPLGAVKARDGRRFTNADVEAVVRNSIERSQTLVIDYEHQTDLAEKNGQPAPAAGWINELAVRKDGIWGRVEWTEKAAAHIRAREYRFISPTFTHSKKAPHNVGVILRAALTNNPALELTALATNKDGDPEMDEFLKALAKLLGLGENATSEEILAAFTGKIDTLATLTALTTTVRTALDVDKDADEKAIASAIDALKQSVATASAGNAPDPAKFVPVDQVKALTEQIAALSATVTEDKATATVEQAMQDGKLPPALKDWGHEYAKRDLKGFTAYCAANPVLVKPGSDVPKILPDTKEGELSAEDKAMCSQLGVSEEKFLETRKKEVEASA